MWGEQVSQDGVLSSLTPHFVYKDYVTAEITCSSAQARHKVLTWSWVLWVCVSSTHKAVGMTTVSWLWLLGQRVYCCSCCISQERIQLWLLCQPGERLCSVRLCYGCCQKRKTCRQFLQSPSSLLACALPILGSTTVQTV